jgi:N-acetylglucosaminyldiphosphoundecaprenol N-acetyl-beta-D-mannosaminyltransferase
MPIERVNVLGVGISAINLALARKAIVAAVQQRRKGYICVTGVHGVMESHDDPAIKAIHNQALLCTPDGMPMVWLGKLRGHRQMARVYGPDLMLEIFAEPGLRHFLHGGAAGVARMLAERMAARFPQAQIVGTYEPPFRELSSEEYGALARQVAAARPDIFWVGLSTPKQERFMAEYLPRLETTLMIGVGAAFDFHAGRVQQAPRWAQRSGLEWLYRLCREPRRLGPRYLKNNPRFLFWTCCQLLHLKRI